jgi:alpha-glucosidase (family GH31 glycosyl hydrolase)
MVTALALEMTVADHVFRCSFTFDPEFFPDPKAYLSDIKKKYDVKICLWSTVEFYTCNGVAELSIVNPYISQLSPIFTEGIEGGFFIKRTDGTPWQYVTHLL